MQLRAVRQAADAANARRIIADAFPPLLASTLRPEQLEVIRQRLLQLPEPGPPRITKRDGLGAMGICLLSFLSTFPIVIPFVLTGDARLALRVSNAVAIVMLFVCGYAFGHYAGFRPWARRPSDGRRRCRISRRCDSPGRMKVAACRIAAVTAGAKRASQASAPLASVPPLRQRT